VKLEIANLKDDIKRSREEDCMVTGYIREELDITSNTKKEFKIIILQTNFLRQ
jgi:hypothetical protein